MTDERGQSSQLGAPLVLAPSQLAVVADLCEETRKVVAARRGVSVGAIRDSLGRSYRQARNAGHDVDRFLDLLRALGWLRVPK